MSIDNLFVPNIYDIFANSFNGTVPGVTGSVQMASMRFLQDPQVLFGFLDGNYAITSYSERGVAGTLPPVLSTIDYHIIETHFAFQGKVIHVTVPQFSILTITGSAAPSGITFQLLTELAPSNTISLNANILSNTGTTSPCQVIIDTTAVCTLKLYDALLFGSPPYLLYGDLCFSYTI